MRRTAVLLCLALVACTRSATPSATLSPSPSPVPSATSGTATPTLVVPTATPSVASPTPKTDLADGPQYVRLTKLDRTHATLTVDVVQFLTGTAAEKAAQEDGQEADNDYYIRNQSTKLRTLGYVPKVLIVVNTLTAEETGSSTEDTQITVEKLASFFAKGEAQTRLFILTLKSGTIVKVAEQYLP